ncbi:hypothetical protein [Nocardioides sp. WS12]|uniref:hypothetical protein n=1 Tax=Nocardioides sp. WS12 TaxID=2486272 RepID=UPI0015F9D15C|nr:hypothetical protein [Nocardioides sp. WS12]
MSALQILGTAMLVIPMAAILFAAGRDLGFGNLVLAFLVGGVVLSFFALAVKLAAGDFG